MHPLTEEIIASKEWRVRELETLKKIGIIALNTYSLREKQQYYRMCIPYIYAHWEGFVVESFKSLIAYLNNEHLDKKTVVNELYTFSLQNVLKPLAGKQSFEQSYQFVEKFVEDFDKELYIDPSLLTANSNLNYKQLTIILNKFGMDNNLQDYRPEINQLVNQRNSIAHGENGIIIEKDHVSNKIAVLQEIFDLIILEFENYLSQKLYLKM
ncbi:MAE_28990/MAE_18760 family HEPN-like nuclease [Lachnoclostridium phocaeense]|uniref:MAE_28990/MAE_18760 family HEPN-like nuclease n=1 Tax=Lachnoclostridium phocaeense TaxID=1871021 RepID=UPI00248DE5CD|nr:MAE_28990/MAE_18760 family HEPN-like nuclease [Lachnoclostridium phocaeense]